MGDRLDRLESELSALRPAPLSASLLQRIDDDLRELPRWSFADRCLAGAISVGAIAACVIGGIFVWQGVSEIQLRTSSSSVVVDQSDLKTGPTLGQYQQAIARAGTSAELFR